MRCSHAEFLYQDGRLDANKKPMTRCSGGFDGIQDGNGTNDCNGHGTHCAGVHSHPRAPKWEDICVIE